MKRRGFTLIELLVVIAIIAILAAILFPVFARARAKAQQNNCLANIKQLSLGVLMYVSDSDNRYPVSWDTVDGYHYWNGAVYPYVKNVQIYACPSTSSTVPVYSQAGGWWQVIPTDYRENPCLGARGGGPGCISGVFPPIKDDAVYKPAEMIMLYETAGDCVNGGWGNGGGYGSNPDLAASAYTGSGAIWNCNSYTNTWQAPAIATRHNNGCNVSYCDGHSKWQSREKMYAFDASAGWNNTP